MKIAILSAAALVMVVGLWATDFTVTVTVDTAMAPDILATVTAWRIRQVEQDGVTPIYPNNNALGQAILFQGLRRILRQQCEFDPNSCPASAKAYLDAKNSAESSFQAEIDAAVTQ